MTEPLTEAFVLAPPQDEFKKVFGMDRDAFVKMPKWKQADAKRKVRLF